MKYSSIYWSLFIINTIEIYWSLLQNSHKYLWSLSSSGVFKNWHTVKQETLVGINFGWPDGQAIVSCFTIGEGFICYFKSITGYYWCLEVGAVSTKSNRHKHYKKIVKSLCLFLFKNSVYRDAICFFTDREIPFVFRFIC